MSLIAIEGDMGTGKSMVAAALAVEAQEEKGVAIYSTMHLYSAYDCLHEEEQGIENGMIQSIEKREGGKFIVGSKIHRHRKEFVCTYGEEVYYHEIEFEFLTLAKFYELFKASEEEDSLLSNAIVLLDESYLFMDARASSSKVNRMFNSFVFQTRKRHVDVLMTTHRVDRLDRRVRESIDETIRPRHNPETGTTRLTIISKNRSIRHKLLIGSNFYAFFDTEEKVVPTGKLFRI